MEESNNKTLSKKEITSFFDLLKSQLIHDFEGKADVELRTLNAFIERLKNERLDHLTAVAEYIITESQYRKFPTLFVIGDVLNILYPMRKIAKKVNVQTLKNTIEEQANKETKEWLKKNKTPKPEEIKEMISGIVEQKTISKGSLLKT